MKNKAVYDNEKYFNQETGETIYPGMNGNPNIDGFVNGKFENEILQSKADGDLLMGRRGSNGGNYFAPAGTPFEKVALPPFMENEPEILFKINKPLPVRTGEVAPWFNQPGGGTQYITNLPVKELIRQGYISEIK